MDLIVAFIITIALITIVSLKFKITPFFTLVGGAILFGLMAGMTLDATLKDIVSGLGRVFSAFGIIIFCGAVIAALLQEQHQTEEIVSDVQRVVKNPPALAGFSGYLLAVPITCCVTAYVMLNPILDCIEKDTAKRNILLYLAAVGSIISYALIFPTPVVIPLFEAFSAGTSPLVYDAVAIPLSLAVLGGAILFYRFTCPEARGAGSSLQPCPAGTLTPIRPAGHGGIHWRAWAPFISILVAIPVSFLLGLSHVGIINFIMLAGAVTAIVLAAPVARTPGMTKGAKHAGMIIFDICGAGALGYVIVHTGFTEGALQQMAPIIPVILIPFILAALIETAQGSRVVTAVITAEVLAGSAVTSAIHPIPFILLISAGSCLVSFVTDPYFWLVQRTTGDNIGTVVKKYTLPVALAGIGIFVVAIALEYLVFR
ncbi:MAG: GntP family permease [Methanoregula sp.]